MGLFDFLKPRKQKSVYDALMENPVFREQKEVYDALTKFIEESGGCDTDELPNGYGEFGLTATNPIPANTPMGSQKYLRQLCTADDGVLVVVGQRCSVTSDVTAMPVDRYELSRKDGRPLHSVYISPYHKRNSHKAPAGFSLALPELL